MNEHAKNVQDSLNELCARMDRGKETQRICKVWWRVPSAVAVGLSLVSCGGSEDEPSQSVSEICTSPADNEDNGNADCDDRNCHNGIDDDFDGLVDCADPDCEEVFGCMSTDAAYAAPF